MAAITRLKFDSATQDSIELNEVDAELNKARFEYEAKLAALAAEFNSRRDGLRRDYHAKVSEITGGAQ